MHLRHGEVMLREVRRHKTPYVLKLSAVFLVSLPLYLVFFLIGDEFSTEWILLLLAVLSFFVGIVITLISFDYLLDKIIISNKRVVWINWKTPIKREEHEAELIDIQDIETREHGILSKLRIFDYGFLEIETAASKTCIKFNDCPDPEGVKHFILNQMEKPMKILHEKRESKAEEDWSVN